MPDFPEGETLASLRAYVDKNRRELIQKPTSHQLHKVFMEKTFPLRRHDILTAPRLVKDVVEDYPSLKKFVHVSIR